MTITLDQTAKKSAIQLVKAATHRQAYVARIVILGGGDYFVMNVLFFLYELFIRLPIFYISDVIFVLFCCCIFFFFLVFVFFFCFLFCCCFLLLLFFVVVVYFCSLLFLQKLTFYFLIRNQ